jgi:hypothetical protein
VAVGQNDPSPVVGAGPFLAFGSEAFGERIAPPGFKQESYVQNADSYSDW